MYINYTCNLVTNKLHTGRSKCIYCYSFDCFHQSTYCMDSARLQNSFIVTFHKWKNLLFLQCNVSTTSTFSIYKNNFRNWRISKCSYKQQSDLWMVHKDNDVAIITESIRFDTVCVIFVYACYLHTLKNPIKQTVIYLCKSFCSIYTYHIRETYTCINHI